MKTNLQWFIYFVVTVTLTNRFCTAAEVQGKEDARKRQPVNMPGNEHFNHLRQYRREALTDYKIVSAEAMHDDIYPTSKIEPSALIQDAFTNHLINTLTSTDNNIELTGLDAVMGSRRSNGHKVQHNHFHEDNQDKVDHSNRDEEDQTFENDHHDYDANMDDRNMEYHRHKETHENTKSYHDHQNEISGIDHESVSYTPPGKNTASDDIELDLNHHPDSVSGEEKDLIEYRHYPNEYTTAKEDEKTKSIEAKPLKDDSTVGYNVDTEFLKKELSAIRQEDKKLDSVINAKYHAQRIEEDTLPEIEKEHHEMNVDNVMNDENEHNEENDERRDKTEANESKMDNIDDDADMDKATSELLDINVSTDGKITESPKIDKFTKESIFEKENLLPYLKLPKRNITTELIIKNSSSPIKTLITNTKEINNNNKIDVNINKGIVNINTQKIIEDIETLRDDLKSSLATSNRIINNEKMSEEAFNNYNIKKKSLIAFARIINRTVPQALILDAFSPVKRNTIDLRHTIKKSTLEHTSDTRKSYKRNDSAKIKKASFSQIKDRKINSRFQENINAYLLSEKHLHPTKHRFDKTQQDLLENMYRKPSKKYGHNKRLMHNSTAYTKQNMRDENGVKKSNKAKTEKRHQRTASHAHTHHYMPLSSTEHNVPQTSLYSRMHNGTAGKTHASIAQITSLNLNVSTPTVESRKSRKRQHHREKEKSKGLKDESNESKRQTIIAPNLFSAVQSYTDKEGHEVTFSVGTQLLTYDNARRVCVQRGGDLASIADEKEGEFVVNNLITEPDNYWIGFDDQTIEGNFEWVDGLPNLYSNWSNLEPDDGTLKNNGHDEDCAIIKPTFDWSDVKCESMYKYICKKSMDKTKHKPIHADEVTRMTSHLQLPIVNSGLSAVEQKGLAASDHVAGNNNTSSLSTDSPAFIISNNVDKSAMVISTPNQESQTLGITTANDKSKLDPYTQVSNNINASRKKPTHYVTSGEAMARPTSELNSGMSPIGQPVVKEVHQGGNGGPSNNEDSRQILASPSIAQMMYTTPLKISLLHSSMPSEPSTTEPDLGQRAHQKDGLLGHGQGTAFISTEGPALGNTGYSTDTLLPNLHDINWLESFTKLNFPTIRDGAASSQELSKLASNPNFQKAHALAEKLAPEMVKSYSARFLPDIGIIREICGRMCGEAAGHLMMGDPKEVGLVCGKSCAKSLLSMSPTEFMSVLSRLKEAGRAKEIKEFEDGKQIAAETITAILKPYFPEVPFQTVTSHLPNVGFQEYHGSAQSNTPQPEDLNKSKTKSKSKAKDKEKKKKKRIKTAKKCYQCITIKWCIHTHIHCFLQELTYQVQ